MRCRCAYILINCMWVIFLQVEFSVETIDDQWWIMINVNNINTHIISDFKYSLPLVWDCMKELTPLIEHSSSRLYSVFISLQLLKTPDSLHKCSTKLIFSFKKSWKWNGLLLTLTSLLNHKNWDLRQHGLSESKWCILFEICYHFTLE